MLEAYVASDGQTIIPRLDVNIIIVGEPRIVLVFIIQEKSSFQSNSAFRSDITNIPDIIDSGSP